MRLKRVWKTCLKKQGYNAATLYLEKKKFVKETINLPAILIGGLFMLSFIIFLFFK